MMAVYLDSQKLPETKRTKIVEGVLTFEPKRKKVSLKCVVFNVEGGVESRALKSFCFSEEVK